MAVQMNEIKCYHSEECRFGSGCIVVNSVDSGAKFSPILKLKLESLNWKLKCFSFIQQNKGGSNGKIFS